MKVFQVFVGFVFVSYFLEYISCDFKPLNLTSLFNVTKLVDEVKSEVDIDKIRQILFRTERSIKRNQTSDHIKFKKFFEQFKRNLNNITSDEIFGLIKHSSHVLEFLDQFIDYFHLITEVSNDEGSFVEKFLGKIEGKILSYTHGFFHDGLKVVLDGIIGKIMDYTGSYEKQLVSTVQNLTDEMSQGLKKLKQSEHMLYAKTQKFTSNAWFTNFPFGDIKFPTPEKKYSPMDSAIPNDPENWSIFGGILEGLAKIFVGVVEPIFELVINKVILPFITEIFKVLYLLIPYWEKLVEWFSNILIYIICFSLSLLVLIDSKFMVFEFLLLFIFTSIKFRQTLASVVFSFIVFLFFGLQRPYPSLFQAIIESLPQQFSHCSKQPTNSILDLVKSLNKTEVHPVFVGN